MHAEMRADTSCGCQRVTSFTALRRLADAQAVLRTAYSREIQTQALKQKKRHGAGKRTFAFTVQAGKVGASAGESLESHSVLGLMEEKAHLPQCFGAFTSR